MSIGKFNSQNVAKQTTILFWMSFAVVVVLAIWGFAIPPKGEIHESVLKIATIIFGFAPVAVTREAIKEGIGVKMRHGDTELEIRDKDKPHKQEDYD